MTDRSGTAGNTTKGDAEAPLWRVDGGESSGDPSGKGLDDTVVRMPRIRADDPPPELPAPPAAQPTKRSARADASAEDTVSHPAAGAGATAPVTRVSPVETFGGADSFLPPISTAPGFRPPPVAAAVPAAAAPAAAKATVRRTRKARLRLARVDPWSVMKTSFLFSIAFGIMFWIATSVLWYVLTSSGLFDAINNAIVNIISNPGNTETWRIEDYINGNKVLGIAALIAVINVVITTALGTLTAFLYNLSANILGGLELTLAED